MGWIKTHQPCPHCDSSDAASLNDRGWWQCFSCDKSWPDKDGAEPSEPKEDFRSDHLFNVPEIEMSVTKAIESRGLTEQSCKKWDYRVGTDGHGQPFHCAVYRDKDGRITGAKLRRKGKNFMARGVPGKAGLYGRHLWPTGGKSVIITEGELDAISVSQQQDHKWPVVSLVNGAASAASDIKKELQWLESFDRVVLMFDNDDAGRAAVAKAVPLFSPGKAHVAKLPADVKDASDLLKAGRGQEIIKAFWDASPWRPDEIIGDGDLLAKMLEPMPTADLLYPYECLNLKTRGIRKREITTITSGTGIGKSQLCREIAFSALNQNKKVGYIALEESVSKTGRSILAMYDGCPWIDWEPGADHMTKLFDKHLKGNFWTYDHWGSQDHKALASRVKYMATSLGVELVVLDHISIVVSGMEGGDERTSLDRLMTALRSLVEQTGIAMVLVSHLRKADGTPHEEGGRVSLRDLRSSNSIAQLSDIVVALERNQQAEDEEESNTTSVRILKNRFTGETGLSGYLRYVPETGRQKEISADEAEAEWGELPDEPTEEFV